MSQEHEPPHDAPAGVSAPPRARRAGLLAVVAVLAVVLDVVTKVVATATLEGSEPVRILGGAVYLQLVRNPDAAFGLTSGMTPVLTVFAALIAGTIVWFASRVRSAGWAVGLGLVLAGALGNVIDRIFRAPGPLHGHVIDFVSLFAPNGNVWPVFNVADSSICVGAALLVLLSILGRDYDGTSARERKAADATAADRPGSGSGKDTGERDGS